MPHVRHLTDANRKYCTSESQSFRWQRVHDRKELRYSSYSSTRVRSPTDRLVSKIRGSGRDRLKFNTHITHTSFSLPFLAFLLCVCRLFAVVLTAVGTALSVCVVLAWKGGGAVIHTFVMEFARTRRVHTGAGTPVFASFFPGEGVGHTSSPSRHIVERRYR